MLFCSLLVINKEPCRVDVFPELLINPSKQKLVMIESNKLNQQSEPIISKGVFPVQNRKKNNE